MGHSKTSVKSTLFRWGIFVWRVEVEQVVGCGVVRGEREGEGARYPQKSKKPLGNLILTPWTICVYLNVSVAQ